MFTPQQLTEIGFTKAIFGGYVMDSVHDVLDPMIEDYTTLYKENAVLKSKLRILVEKLEEYRRQEGTPHSTEGSSQNSQEIIREAEEQAAEIIRKAREQAAGIVGNAKDSASLSARACAGELQIEEERLAQAKEAAASFIHAMESDIHRHLELLDNLKMLDLPDRAGKAAEPKAGKPPKGGHQKNGQQKNAQQKNGQQKSAPQKAAQPKPQTTSEDPDDIALQIEQNLEKLVSSVPNSTFDTSVQDTKVIRPLHPESITAKFGDLQFGKNYNPK